MIAVDSNVLIRLIVRDDAVQAEKARVLFDSQAASSDLLWIADVVVAEMVWALARSYNRSRSDIVSALRALAGNASVQLESAACFVEATSLYEAGPANFVDCLLAVKARAAGCQALRSVDKAKRKLPGVVLL